MSEKAEIKYKEDLPEGIKISEKAWMLRGRRGQML